jgi:ABC-type phosphate transport system permease subunit
MSKQSQRKHKKKIHAWKITMLVGFTVLAYAVIMLVVMINAMQFSTLEGFFNIYVAVGVYGYQVAVPFFISIALFITSAVLKSKGM